MHIYFLRHGDASSHARYEERERPLTDLGVRQATLVGTFLQQMNIMIDGALSSPLRRAQETASIALSGNRTQEVVLTEFLLNGSDPQQLYDQLDELQAPSVLVVGHEPLLSEMISRLIGSKGSAEIEMRKCSLALVDSASPIRQGAGILKFLIPVDTLIWTSQEKTRITDGTQNSKN